MEVTKSTSNMDFGIIIKLSEKEARALEAITLYGTKEFLKFFYQNLGTVYLKPNEDGLINLFKTINEQLPQHLDKFDKIREIWIEDNLKNQEL
jgi:hypothetical protein